MIANRGKIEADELTKTVFLRLQFYEHVTRALVIMKVLNNHAKGF